MIIMQPFPYGCGPLWSARLGQEADASMRGTGMTVSLPGTGISAVSAATPPRADGGTPPQAPARMKAALTFLDHQAVFVACADGAPLSFRFLRGPRRKRAPAAQES